MSPYFTADGVDIFLGDCRQVLRALPPASVQTCVTSPPYFGLRDYGTATWDGGDAECDHMGEPFRTKASINANCGTGNDVKNREARQPFKAVCSKCGARRIDNQIGLEETPERYVAEMVAVFAEVRRVLRDDGTLWLNLGDSYNSAASNQNGHGLDGKVRGGNAERGRNNRTYDGLKPKDLLGIPWSVAFALRADGWVLRQEIIWQKPNPMPESVQDRCTKSHEQIFMFAKAKWSGPAAGRFAHVSNEDARWLALFVDAEGCIVLKRCRHEGRGDTFAPQVSIGSTNKTLLGEVARITGHGTMLERPGKNAPMFYWQVGNNIARDLLARIYPFLIVKQRQARIGIYVDDLTYYRGGQKPERKQRTEAENALLVSLWERNKACNHFGDPDLSDVPEPKVGRWGDCERYFYDADAIREPLGEWSQKALVSDWSRNVRNVPPGQSEQGRIRGGGVGGYGDTINPLGRNKRSVWTVNPRPYPGAHFATFPPDLIEPCILAGSKPGDAVLDPFNGSGTTGEVCQKWGRRYVGIELNAEYIDLSRERFRQGVLFGATA